MNVFRISYRETAQIAECFAEMLRVGMPMEKIFAILMRHRRTRRSRDALEALQAAIQRGRKFHEGLQARPRAWPRYFIELVRCSERAGMLHEGFTEGAIHFRKLAAAWRAVNMLWIGPALIIGLGWLIRGGIRLYANGLGTALLFWAGCLQTVLIIAAIVAIIRFVPPIRRLFDAAILHFPLLGETVRDINLYQFTSCFRYLYIGAVSAPEMVRMAAEALDNTDVSRRLGEAAERVRNGAKFAEALEPAEHWPSGYMEALRVAEYSGQLQSVLDKLAEERREALVNRVDRIRKVTEPLVMYAVAAAIVFEMLHIVTVWQARVQQPIIQQIQLPAQREVQRPSRPQHGP